MSVLYMFLVCLLMCLYMLACQHALASDAMKKILDI